MYKWKVLETEDVSPHKRWLPAFRDKVKLHNGNILDDFYYVKFGEIAIVLPILKSGKIVFIRQYRHAIGEVMIELPAGMVENGRKVEEVALSELEEETGIRATEKQLIQLGRTAPSPHKVGMLVYGFVLKDLEFNTKQELEPDENIELVTMTPGEAFKKVKNGEIYQSDTIAFLTIAREKGFISI